MAGFLLVPCTKQLSLTDVIRSVFRVETIQNARSFSNHKISPRQELVQCHRILGVKVGSTPDQVREAFLSLAKRFHPDGSSPEADDNRFQEVEKAYRKLQVYFAEQRTSAQDQPEHAEDIEQPDIRHTAPQHRQYLSFDGYGAGTPAQREKQHRKMRAYRATENVFEHRIKKISTNTEQGLIVKDKIESRKIKTRYGMDRLVEDLIQESMAKGDFDNLSGRGKPLQYRSPNPYVDFVTQKMNEVLIDNGFTPEWITLQKEIRCETQEMKEKLEKARALLGPIPMNNEDEKKWSSILNKTEPDAKALNAKINKYNLLVPILQKQMLQFRREAQEILEHGKFWPVGVERPKPPRQTTDWEQENLFNIIFSLFTAK